MSTLSPDVHGPIPLDDGESSVDAVALGFPNDHQTFALLYEQYKKPLERYLLRQVKDREAVDDLCQDVFTNAWKHISQQEHIPQQFAAYVGRWLYRIAKNLAIDYNRHTKRYEFLPLPENEPDEPKGYAYMVDLSEPGHEDWLCGLLYLKEVLTGMSPQYRECVLLRAEGLSMREIAMELGIKEKTVSANVSRGFVQLRLRILKEGCHDLNDFDYSLHIIVGMCISFDFVTHLNDRKCCVMLLARVYGPASPPLIT